MAIEPPPPPPPSTRGSERNLDPRIQRQLESARAARRARSSGPSSEKRHLSAPQAFFLGVLTGVLVSCAGAFSILQVYPFFYHLNYKLAASQEAERCSQMHHSDFLLKHMNDDYIKIIENCWCHVYDSTKK